MRRVRPAESVVLVVRFRLELTKENCAPISDGASGSLPAAAWLAAWLVGVKLVGLLRICASPLDAFQSALTFTSAPLAMPSSLVLSALDIDPAAEVVAALMEIAGVVPPEDEIGAMPVTEVTCAVLATLPRPSDVRWAAASAPVSRARPAVVLSLIAEAGWVWLVGVLESLKRASFPMQTVALVVPVGMRAMSRVPLVICEDAKANSSNPPEVCSVA